MIESSTVSGQFIFARMIRITLKFTFPSKVCDLALTVLLVSEFLSTDVYNGVKKEKWSANQVGRMCEKQCALMERRDSEGVSFLTADSAKRPK